MTVCSQYSEKKMQNGVAFFHFFSKVTYALVVGGRVLNSEVD
jgi:hypothetical protein